MNINPEIKEKIITAANALAAEGNETPTNDQVRERMGSGSLSHISPVMREWRESRKAEIAIALQMPADLKKVIETSLGQVWTASSKLATANMESVQQQADTAIKTVTNERDEALTEVTRLEERLAELQKILDHKDQIVDQMRTALEKARNQDAKLTTENAALVAQVSDREAQLKELKASLKAERKNNQALQGELVEIARGSA